MRSSRTHTHTGEYSVAERAQSTLPPKTVIFSVKWPVVSRHRYKVYIYMYAYTTYRGKRYSRRRRTRRIYAEERVHVQRGSRRFASELRRGGEEKSI